MEPRKHREWKNEPGSSLRIRPPLPSELLREVEEKLDLPQKSESRFAQRLAQANPALVTAIGSGAAGFVAFGAASMLKNPVVLDRLAVAGVTTVKAAIEHWEEINLAHDLISFVGWENTFKILKFSAGFVSDNWELFEGLIDTSALVIDGVEAVGTLGLGIALGAGIKWGFDKYNADKKDRLEQLVEEAKAVGRVQIMLEQQLPPVQLAQVFDEVPARHLVI